MPADNEPSPVAKEARRAVERVYRDWDEALGAKDLDAALDLYAPDATLESPLVRHHLGVDEGIIRGREDLRRFILNGIVWTAKLDVPAGGVQTDAPDLAAFAPASIEPLPPKPKPAPPADAPKPDAAKEPK